MKSIRLLKNPGGESDWTCAECGRILSSRSNLLRHMALVHSAPFTQVNVKKRTGKPVYNEEDFEDK